MWQKASVGVSSKLASSLEASNQKLFPNIYTCLHLLMIIPMHTAATEHSHSCLQVVKTKLQSTMGQNRLNALMLLYIHKDIPLNYNKITDLYAKGYPRKMNSNPLAEVEKMEIILYGIKLC